MRRRIVRELQIMHGCHSDYIVTFYGAFLNENNDVIMCMEYMDVGFVSPQAASLLDIRTDRYETAPSTASHASSDRSVWMFWARLPRRL
jgi:serine/threonine protein kinase